jgi:hypothetical protein
MIQNSRTSSKLATYNALRVAQMHTDKSQYCNLQSKPLSTAREVRS